MYPEAIAELHAARAVDDAPDLMALLGHAYAANGEKEKALALLRQLQSIPGRLIPRYFLALIHAGLGDSNAAIGDLQMALVERSVYLVGPGLFGIANDPHLDPLRSDARFQQLLRDMRLP